MTREEKSKVIETYCELGDAKTLYLTDIAGLDAATTTY